MSIRTEHVYSGRVYPPDSHGDGIHAVTTPYTEIHTRYGTGYNVDGGAHAWLFDGAHLLGGVSLICRRVAYPDVQQAAIQEIEPWAASIARLAEAGRLEHASWQVSSLLGEPDYEQYVVDDCGGYDEWKAAVRKLAKTADLVRPEGFPAWAEWEGEPLGRAITARLTEEQVAARAAAVDALPSAADGLPALSDDWRPGRSVFGIGLPETWVGRLAPLVLERWRRESDTASRDHVISWAHGAGISKAEIHRETGVARTTIDRVLNSSH